LANDERISLIEKTIEANEYQKMKMVKKIKDKMGDLNGKRIGVLGLTFKPNTDDMREASALVILPELVKQGASIKAFDPEGMVESKWRLKDIEDSVEYCEDEYAAISGCDGLVILTEWNQFRSLDLNQVKSLMKDHYFFDFRNIYSRDELEQMGFVYTCVGR
jgi:UDPglucose 6-dehydrogenase